MVKRLSAIRRGYPALTVGDLAVRWSSDRTGDEPDAGVFAFERTGGDAGDQYALVVFNTNQNHPSSPQFNGAPMTATIAAGTVLVDVLSKDRTEYTVAANGGVTITLEPTTGAILIPKNQVVPGL